MKLFFKISTTVCAMTFSAIFSENVMAENFDPNTGVLAPSSSPAAPAGYAAQIIGEYLADIASKPAPYAQLADMIYTADSNSQWELLQYQEKDKTDGFNAGVYRNRNTGEIAVAFGGTTAVAPMSMTDDEASARKAADFITDALLSLSRGKPEQLKSADSFIKDAIAKYGPITTVTGHSLGGGIAQYVALKNGIPAVTFNTAPLSLSTEVREELGLLYASHPNEGIITNFRSANDPLTGFTEYIATHPSFAKKVLQLLVDDDVLPANSSPYWEQLSRMNFGKMVELPSNTGHSMSGLLGSINGWLPKSLVTSSQWATVAMQNQLSAITNGGASHIGSASLYTGYNNQQPNANVNPTNTNNYQTQTGSQQTGYSTNSQAFQSSDWVMVTGNAATHTAVGNSFGSIVAPDGGQIASLNNANVQYTLITKDFFVPIGTKQVTLSFNGNFVTNEYPVYVGSQYNDFASVKITSPSGNVTPVTAFNETLNSGNFQTVNGLPSPLSATGGQTGFKASTATINVAGGGKVTVEVKVANVGDTAVPSAVLLNKIIVK